MMNTLVRSREQERGPRRSCADGTQAFGEFKAREEPRTAAYLIWQEPFMVAGGYGTFVNDMLMRCGLVNVFDEGDARYPEIRPGGTGRG